MSNPRIEAIKILTKFEKNSSFSSIALTDEIKSKHFKDSRDTALTVSLVYGVLEHKKTLDYNINFYLAAKSKIKPELFNVLRIGCYQLLYLDKIPVSAAVNESVKAAKVLGFSYASGMVNAVLRKISQSGLLLPEISDINNYLSIKYSVNIDIVGLLIKQYGYEKTEEIFINFEGRRPIYIRCNKLKCSEELLISQLAQENVIVKKTSLEGCYAVECTGDIAQLKAYKDGYFYVQDMSSQICCKLLAAKPDDTVVDCCAAPGGKSFTVAQYMNNTGVLYSCDLYEHKIDLINKSSNRLGIRNIKTICSDARLLKSYGIKADRVLCDVPCSGLGVIGRKPEIRYKSLDEISALSLIQKEILYSCAEMVKPGGTLIYSTCSINKNENEQVCDTFLNENPDFSVDLSGEYGEITDRYITLFPNVDSGDGFFIAKFIRGE